MTSTTMPMFIAGKPGLMTVRSTPACSHPDMGIIEDPATGSAAAAFAGVIRHYDGLTAGTHHIRIEQGFEMGRPSLIDLEIDVENGDMHAIRVGGQATLVARGELFL
jgi:trans-2,3-dihydro-3-hydroxyanthranilate isomerase